MIQLPLAGPSWVFFTLAVVILVAPLVAERLRLPGVIGLVAAGLVVGPEGLGLVARAGTIEQLGGFGLLYLMFLAGLELDLEVLSSNRRPPIVFGLLTFTIPMILGTLSARLLGFEILTSVLIGSLWASHTLVAYPVVRRSGIVGDGSVVATVGATVITDTLALLVLAVVAGSTEASGGLGFLVTLIPGLGLLAMVALWLLPLMARWFFVGIGQDKTLRFLFVLAGFLGTSVLAEIVGIEGIVGAFLAGLALNRLVSNGGALMQRVEFVGSAIFIPIFLISVGMLIDVNVVIDPETLRLALAFIAVAMGAKWLAAEIAGRIFGYDRSQVGVMFALSNAQAAATLAATIVGFQLGLFEERVVNAVLIVILVTVAVASWVAARSAPKVAIPAAPPHQLGRMVLTPVANPATSMEILRLGAWAAHADAGHLVPFHVVTSPDSERVRAADPLVRQVEASAASFGVDVDAFVRVDRSVASGVVNTVVERDASLVLVGWKGETTARDRVFGSLLDDIIERVPCIVAACRLPGSDYKRVVVVAQDVNPGELTATFSLCKRLARGGGLSVVVVGAAADADLDSGWDRHPGGSRAEDLIQMARHGDLILLSAGSSRSTIGSLALELVRANPGLGVVVVHPPTPSLGLGVSEIFAGS